LSHWLRFYKTVKNMGHCIICGSLTNMMQTNKQYYLCEGSGIGGVNPSSDAFCHNLYKKRYVDNPPDIV